VRVCSQHAKKVLNSVEQVTELLKGNGRTAVCLAPSFPAEFSDLEPERLASMLRALGFDLVTEVGFGADLVAREYRDLLSQAGAKRYIATTCPAIIGYVEKYQPALVPALAPIVSPMIAMARALHKLHGEDLKVVFIGPCIAKKGEAAGELVSDEISAVLTFKELQELFEQHGVKAQSVQPGDFDPPHAGPGALFSISRGLLQAADIREDLMTGDVVTAEGGSDFVMALREFEEGALDAKLLEILCCNGCIMGAGMSSEAPRFRRRAQVSNYVRKRMKTMDKQQWEEVMEKLKDLYLRREFISDDQRIPVPSIDEIANIMARMGKFTPEDELNCGACGYETCREHAVAIYKGLAESEMCLPNTIEKLRKTIQDLAVSNEQLADTQEALMHSEKLAHMGQLAAGIAHEVNNPLGVVLMYAHMLVDECERSSPLKDDLGMIVEQADRCKKIVAGLLHFARQNKVQRHEIDLRKLIDDSLRTLTAPENIRIDVEHDLDEPMAELDRDQMIQVLTNLASNAIGAMPDGGTLTIRTSGDERMVHMSVSDTGVGIPKENLDKIFEPFYTTKQIGMGTGLGLAVIYGIVKMHRGNIRVESKTDEAEGPTGTTFTVSLPRREE
jgi:signal transduction histidine kinase